MFADGAKVAGRRLRRRLKAAASIVVALMAGTFLACRGDDVVEDPKPTGDPVTPPPPPEPSASASAAPSASASASTSAMVPAPPPAPKPTVDRKEHRKGMPVPDNLLE